MSYTISTRSTSYERLCEAATREAAQLDPGLALPDGTPLSDLLSAIGAGQRVERVADLPS